MKYEWFYSAVLRGRPLPYDYRTPDGRLFSCIAKTLEEARARRARWLAREGGRP